MAMTSFGPHPRHAVVPVLLVVVLLGWIAAREPADRSAGAAAGRDGSVAPVTPVVPVEALYGVPAERNMHLWRPGP